MDYFWRNFTSRTIKLPYLKHDEPGELLPRTHTVLQVLYKAYLQLLEASKAPVAQSHGTAGRCRSLEERAVMYNTTVFGVSNFKKKKKEKTETSALIFSVLLESFILLLWAWRAWGRRGGSIMSAARGSKQWLVLHGGSTDYRSRYATTSTLTQSRGCLTLEPSPPAKPWMGEGQSRKGCMPSGFQTAYIRDAPPPGGCIDYNSSHRSDFKRPHTSGAGEEPPHYPGDKNREPLTSCLQRGADKCPRYYPFAVGAHNNAERLIQPPEADPAERFERSASPAKGSIFAPSDGASVATMKVRSKGGVVVKPPTAFSLAMMNDAAKLISAPQTDGIIRTPALTVRQSERVLSDSTKRFFHLRDYADATHISSSRYFQEDTVRQAAEEERKRKEKAAAKAVRPETQFALMHFTPPFANDVGDGVGAIGQSWGRCDSGLGASWGEIPQDVPRVGLLPTGYTTNEKSLFTNVAEKEEPPAPPLLPERFARQRSRNDFLRWGGQASRYETTSRAGEGFRNPLAQVPIGGVRQLPTSVMNGERSGYHLNVSANPIPDWE
jgi:hypothetical protein